MAVTLNASTSSGLVQTADTSGNIELQSNGTTKATVSSSGLAIGQYNPSTSLITSGTAVASTSGTSIDFTSIPSWVKRITVMFQGVSTNGSSPPIMRLGTSGGFVTSGYASGGIYTGATTGSGNRTDGLLLNGNGTVAGVLFQGHSVLTNISGNSWVQSFVMGQSESAYAVMGGGSISLAGTLTQVRITTANGSDTFDAGTINILYE
jgi:hypothetical protein